MQFLQPVQGKLPTRGRNGSHLLDHLQSQQVAQVANALGVVAVVGNTMKGRVVVEGAVTEGPAAPIGKELVGVVHFGFWYS